MQDIKTVSFNVNGLNNPCKRNRILSKLRKDKVQIAFLQETHLNEAEHAKLNKSGFKHVHSSSYKSGPRRGVAILISHTVNYEHISDVKDKEGRFILIIGKVEGTVVSLLNVYAPPGSDWAFYKQVFDIMVTKAQGILINAADYNLRLQPHLDASGGNPEPKPIAKKVTTLMKEIGIVDVWREMYPSSRDYTHYSAPHSVYSRIDFFFVFNRDFHRIKHCNIGPIALSDHSPIYMTICLNINRRSTLWRFNSSILNNSITKADLKNDIETYMELNDNGEVSPSVLWDALKAVMRGKIISLTTQAKKMRNQLTHDLEIKLKHLQRSHVNSLDTGVKQEMQEIKNKLEELGTQEIKKKMLFTKQRYYEVGGKSMKLLAYKLKKQQADNTIFKIKNPVTGAIETSQEKIKESFNTFYKNLYSQPQTNTESQVDSFLASLDLPTVNENQNKELIASITQEELEAAISRLKGGKSPGTDGYTAEWYKGMKEELMPILLRAFNWVMQTGETPSSWREAVISVLPKEGKDKVECNSYRPISLLNLDYKLFTSILTQRLDKILPHIISNSQTGFIRQRQTQDNIKRTLHILDKVIQSGEEAALLSFDAHKAYDSVFWSFLFKVLHKFGFHKSIIKTIQALYKNPTARIKINGDLTEPFILERGVRQGCSASCCLFALFIEPLSQMIRQNENIIGINMIDGNHKLALFADDLLIFSGMPTQSIPILMDGFEKYGSFSGYKLNVDKTQIMTYNYNPPRSILERYDLKWNADSIRYLGIVLPKDISRLTDLNYGPLNAQIKNDVARWNLIPFLSLSSRIDSVKMNILPRLLYLFQSLPVEVSPNQFREWDILISRFIWQGKRPRIRYKTLQLQREVGGLGLPCLHDYYCAAQLRTLVCWCTSSYSARWKDIETAMAQGIPLAAIIGDDKLINNMKSKNNPWINTTLKIWQETLRKHNLKNGAKMLRWCAYDTDFIPNRTDSRFLNWSKMGITYNYTFVHKGAPKSFESLQREFGFGKSDFYRYLQLRHYMNETLSGVMYPESSDLLRVFLSAKDSPTCSGTVSELYKGLQQNTPENTWYIKDKWEAEGNFSITAEDWEKTCETLKQSTCSSVWREFNWKNHMRYFITPLQKNIEVLA